MKHKKIILLYNAINTPLMSKESASINLGLLAISSSLKSNGYRTILLRNIEEPGSFNKLKKYLSRSLFIGISCMTGDPITNAIKISKIIKKISPNFPIVWGGYHPTIDFQNTIKEKYVDYIVRGQGEVTVVELAKQLEKLKPNLKIILGLVYKQKGRTIVNPPRPNLPISNFPFLDYNLYFHTYPQNLNQDFIYCSSRGCPFECTFCSVSNFYHRQYFEYSDKRFISDLEKIVKQYNPKLIFFWDDNFFVDLNRVKLFFQWYLKTNQKFKWSAFSRCNTFANSTDEFILFLKKTNCQKILFGAESGSLRMLRLIKKHIIPNDIIKSCQKLTPYKIIPDYTFISGFPQETNNDFLQTIKIIKKLREINSESSIRIFSFTPTPGLPILNECVKKGFKLPNKLFQWSQYEYHSYLAPWLNDKQKKMITTLVWLTTFSADSSCPISSNPFYKILIKILKYDANIRLKYNIFHLPFEWQFIYRLYKKHYT